MNKSILPLFLRIKWLQKRLLIAIPFFHSEKMPPKTCSSLLKSHDILEPIYRGLKARALSLLLPQRVPRLIL